MLKGPLWLCQKQKHNVFQFVFLSMYHVFLRIISRGHGTQELAVSVGKLVTFLIRELFSHYHSCPTVRDWIATYPALFIMFVGRNTRVSSGKIETLRDLFKTMSSMLTNYQNIEKKTPRTG